MPRCIILLSYNRIRKLCTSSKTELRGKRGQASACSCCWRDTRSFMRYSYFQTWLSLICGCIYCCVAGSRCCLCLISSTCFCRLSRGRRRSAAASIRPRWWRSFSYIALNIRWCLWMVVSLLVHGRQGCSKLQKRRSVGSRERSRNKVTWKVQATCSETFSGALWVFSD